MWYTWCGPNCKIGFCSNVQKKTNLNQKFQDFLEIQFYKKNELGKAILQKNLILDISCRICDKHFVEADIEAITTNSWKTRLSRS